MDLPIRRLSGKAASARLSRVPIPSIARGEPWTPPASLSLSGTSPPGVFIGRYGYPKVNVGPLLPPFHGDTTLLDLPEAWLDFDFPEIIAFRFSLVRGMRRVAVNVSEGGRFLDQLQELALAARPADLELAFSRPPRGGMSSDRVAQPFGPSAPLLQMGTSGVKTDARLERVWGDGDLRAGAAILRLYDEGVEVSRIMRALSAGVLGLEDGRKLVPTRWSITAVDDALGLRLLEDVRTLPLIDAFRVYESVRLDNRFLVLLLPRVWSYELLEAWFPRTTWNPSTREIAMIGDSEGYRGRKAYASIRGCYYAARFAVAEALAREGRQATAIVLRETHAGHFLPLGVWNVRENVRRALRQPYLSFPDLTQALSYVGTRFEIPLEEWIRQSAVISFALRQRRLTDYPGWAGW
ncbi:MAG: Nre family DNA repair protein [Candidatus Thermoplasmatota archaeon]|nr:Nre family DNA repair protein [Candidatus Thermoplasmatota archaeon]